MSSSDAGVQRSHADPGVRPQPGPRLPDHRHTRALRPGLGVRRLLRGGRLQVLRQAVLSQASSRCPTSERANLGDGLVDRFIHFLLTH